MFLFSLTYKKNKFENFKARKNYNGIEFTNKINFLAKWFKQLNIEFRQLHLINENSLLDILNNKEIEESKSLLPTAKNPIFVLAAFSHSVPIRLLYWFND